MQLFIQTALISIPVDGSKLLEVLHHNAVKVSEAILFPKIVQVGHSILPQPGNLTERPDDAAALWELDHWYTAAAARA